MNSLQTGVALSVGVHLLLFFNTTSFVRSHPMVALTPDYHLPLDVELIQPAASSSPLPVREISSPVAPAETKKSELQNTNTNSKTKKRVPLAVTPPNQTKPDVSSNETVKKSSRAEVPTPSSHAWNVPPNYPETSRRLGQEGRVILSVELDSTGKVIAVQVTRSSGFPELDSAATQAVSNWKMDLPANGNRRMFIPVTFKLQS